MIDTPRTGRVSELSRARAAAVWLAAIVALVLGGTSVTLAHRLSRTVRPATAAVKGASPVAAAACAAAREMPAFAWPADLAAPTTGVLPVGASSTADRRAISSQGDSGSGAIPSP
jgi:hypothetical protein